MPSATCTLYNTNTATGGWHAEVHAHTHVVTAKHFQLQQGFMQEVKTQVQAGDHQTRFVHADGRVSDRQTGALLPLSTPET